MFRLLIVDDEAYVVDGLYNLFEGQAALDLDVYRSYSAIEALQLLERTKIDIVVSDIRMPGMTGLELQQKITEKWPKCKVVFLSGYDDFAYVRTAARYGGVDYVLKTEEDQDIVSAVARVIDMIKSEMASEQFLLRAKEQLSSAKPLLQREYLFAHLAGNPVSPLSMEKQFYDLDIALHPQMPCLLVTGRVDTWKDSVIYADKMLFLYAVQNIASECLSNVLLQPINIDSRSFVWFVQPKPLPSAAEGSEVSDKTWEQSIRYVYGMMESVQQTCRSLLHLSVSIVVGEKPAEWNEMPLAYSRLKNVLFQGFGKSDEMLVSERAIDRGDPSPPLEVSWQKERLVLLNLAHHIKHALENGDQEEFARLYAELSSGVCKRHLPYSCLIEVYGAVITAVMSNLNGLSADRGDAGNNFGIGQLLPQNEDSVFTAFESLGELANRFINRKRDDAVERTCRLVIKINRHIDEHLDGDLSLTALAELVYLNPSYLSRLYKQATGAGLTEYIADSRIRYSKQKLAEIQYKIHEVGKSVGFHSSPYFTTFFKKYTGLTPQQFRDSLNK